MKQANSYKRWERLLDKYGERYSKTYQREPGVKPHSSEQGFIEYYETEEESI